MKYILIGSIIFSLFIKGGELQASPSNIYFSALDFDGYALQTSKIHGVIFNNGGVDITSFNVNVSIDNGAATSESFLGVSVPLASYYSFTFTNPSTFPSTGAHSIKVWTSMPNGSADTNPGDDTITQDLIVLQYAPEKNVLLEEFTGEWCGYCPDGDYKTELVADSFQNHVVVVAYHNGDPMAISEDNTLEQFYNNNYGFPSGMIDRFNFNRLDYDIFTSRFDWFNLTYQRLQMVTPADVVFSGFQYDSVSKNFSVNVTTNFYGEASGSFQLDLVITEDSIISSGQHNYYNDGSIDPNSPFVGVGDPIPGYAHNKVARDVLYAPSSTVPSSIPSIGGSYSYTFTGTLHSDWNFHQVHFAGMLYRDSSNPDLAQVINCNELDIATSSVAFSEKGFSLSVFPNPMNDISFVEFILPHPAPVNLFLYDAFGNLRRTLLQTELPSGMHQVAWNGKDDAGNVLPSGIYFLVNSDGSSFSSVKVIRR